MKKLLTLLLAVLLLAGCAGNKSGTFEAGKNTFLLNGKPFVVKAAEVHYPRIPREYWEHRIEMCKALGMNTLCLYVFWNLHEETPGNYDFTGNKDIAAFCKLAQKHGMYVIVRPGPYVCAEWEMGGLPWWLLKNDSVQLRTLDPFYMQHVGAFMHEVGKQLQDLQITRGGNIIMVQVENEYGSYGTDKPYVSAIRDTVRAAGFTEVPLFQCDWSSNFLNNGLDDLLWTVNFGTGADIDKQFAKLKEVRPDGKTGDMIVKLVNLLPVAVNAKVELPSLEGMNTTAVKTVLAGKPTDKQVRPVAGTMEVSEKFGYELPAYSFTVIRINKNEK